MISNFVKLTKNFQALPHIIHFQFDWPQQRPVIFCCMSVWTLHRSTFIAYIVTDVAVLPPHISALHQQQQQRSRMLGLMQSTSAQTAASQTQFPSATAPRMPFQGGGSSGNGARNLFPSPTESSATNSDSVYYPRSPVMNLCTYNNNTYMTVVLWNFAAA